MTSIHMNSNESQTSTSNSANLNGGLNQIQANPTRYDDEVERRRQFREALSRHHAETTEIHQRTQPMIDDQIHEDTLKYLKTGPVNGTKAKSQKPRAPKRQRTTASNTSANQTNINPNINSNNNNTSNGLNQYQSQTPARPIGTNNNPHLHYAGVPQLQHQNQLINHQQPLQQQQLQQPLQQPIPQQQRNGPPIHPQSRHIMQQASPQVQVSMTAGLQPTQHISTFSPNSQQSIHFQPQQPNQIHQAQSYNDNYQNGYQTQTIYQQPQQHMQQIPQGDQHTQPIDQSHHQYMNMPNNTFAQQNQSSFYTPQMISNITNHSLPTDLDLNLQAGLECDVESLIKHEISVEGQLEFNQDLLVKLDNYYYHQPNYQ